MYGTRRTATFDGHIDALRTDFSRIDVAVQFAEKILERHADVFPSVIGMDFRYLRTRPFPGVPALAIIYRIDEAEHLVHLMRAESCEE
jgi:hypothetical protein